MGLEEYQKKRDFTKTNEPMGQCTPTKPIKEGESKAGSIYVIQKHNASRLHYDLRLEIDNVLKSWAVPKEPPTETGIKRLAVQTEDHPIEYKDFEGEIAEGEYGGGIVKTWDKGSFKALELKEDKIIFEIDGDRLKGAYCLIRLKDKKNWLFFKKKE